MSRWRKTFGDALAGIVHCLRTQRNFRVHVAVAAVVTLACVMLRLNAFESALIVVMVTMVLAAEMVNTVVESVVDLATAEMHPLARIAKDVAAGVVLVTCTGAALAGLVIFGPHLADLFFR